MKQLIDVEGRVDWNSYNKEEQLVIENSQMLTGLLYSMCKVQIVLKTDDENGINEINTEAISESLNNADTVFKERDLVAIQQ